MPAVECFASISSTNDYLKGLLAHKEPPQLPFLVLAETQTAGRGRGSNTWWSGSGCLAMSLGWNLLDKGIDRNELPQFSPMIAAAVIQAIKNTCDFDWKDILSIHQPNDIYANGKKLGGILLESPSPKFAVIGIGLNVNNRIADIPPEFSAALRERQVDSLIDTTGNETDLSELAAEIVKNV